MTGLLERIYVQTGGQRERKYTGVADTLSHARSDEGSRLVNDRGLA